jgi:putative ATP-binding cassette transporter
MSKTRDAPVTKLPQSTADASPNHKFLERLNFLKPYWLSSDQKWKAWALLGGVVALTVAEIAFTAGMGLGFEAALNALVAKQATTFVLTGGATLASMGASTLAANGCSYMTSVLGQNWRGWLSRQFSEAWLSGKAYLRFQHSKRYAQDPDQRIAETVPNVTGTTLSLGLGIFRSAVSIATFSVMLWHISPIMLGAAIVCTGGSYAATHWAGASMRGVLERIMNTEAKFRHALQRVRDSAKPIALAGLESVENETLKNDFNKLDKTRRELYKVDWKTGVVNYLNLYSAVVVPTGLMVPKFFAGTATIGSLYLARQIYSQCFFALSWLPQNYSSIASWSANVNQLMDFHRDLEDNKAEITSQAPKSPNPGAAIAPPPPQKLPSPKSPTGPKP